MENLKALALTVATACLAACATQTGAREADAPVCDTRNAVIYFGSWESDLNAAARTELSTLQSDLRGCAIERVQIVGLAGAPGDQAANIEVSQRRAEAVASALEAGGWPRSTFAIAARGEDGATLPDGTEAMMRRRTEVTVTTSAR